MITQVQAIGYEEQVITQLELEQYVQASSSPALYLATVAERFLLGTTEYRYSGSLTAKKVSRRKNIKVCPQRVEQSET